MLTAEIARLATSVADLYLLHFEECNEGVDIEENDDPIRSYLNAPRLQHLHRLDFEQLSTRDCRKTHTRCSPFRLPSKSMIGRADIEGSKSNVAMNAWLLHPSFLASFLHPYSLYSSSSIRSSLHLCRLSSTHPFILPSSHPSRATGP
ncbi:hypothetical protein BC939DRAFT_49674 [Gamsiella multidivaricata]|nr:hypothetical protein BC939DRAFT_49674 [Gamsiella multidivaricata]